MNAPQRRLTTSKVAATAQAVELSDNSEALRHEAETIRAKVSIAYRELEAALAAADRIAQLLDPVTRAAGVAPPAAGAIWISSSAAAELACRGNDTIENWCRNGIIVAQKQAGRWMIDRTSLREHLKSTR